jgi:hypothetical protein
LLQLQLHAREKMTWKRKLKVFVSLKGPTPQSVSPPSSSQFSDTRARVGKSVMHV